MLLTSPSAWTWTNTMRQQRCRTDETNENKTRLNQRQPLARLLGSIFLHAAAAINLLRSVWPSRSLLTCHAAPRAKSEFCEMLPTSRRAVSHRHAHDSKQPSPPSCFHFATTRTANSARTGNFVPGCHVILAKICKYMSIINRQSKHNASYYPIITIYHR